ncbi:hypothetical protein [Halotalea alkalilenta]|uniref:hypothetical protein n=1 Tax=Halotalea alkalilenta TaxID=376489 RepID=UPI0005B9F3DC|nr:hypothetical protein [Halotalea alkalilenta]
MKSTKIAVAAGFLLAALGGYAEAQQPHGQELVQQCVDLAEARDGSSLGTHLVRSNNVERYVEGQPFELKVALEGHGNTFFNLDCMVKNDGAVSFRGYAESGMPAE